VTLSDWEHIAERFEKGTHYTEKALYKVLVKEIVPVITEELRVSSVFQQPFTRPYHVNIAGD
jgi:tyrosine-protein phosphatase YwqE